MNGNIHDRTNYSYMNKLYYCPINNMWFYPYMMNPYMCSYTRNTPSYACMENCMENNYRFAEENTINKQYNNNKEEIEHIDSTDENSIKQNNKEDNLEEKKESLNNRQQELDDIMIINDQREGIIIEDDEEKNTEECKQGYLEKENIEKQEIKNSNRNSNFSQNKNRQSENINLTNNIANIKMRKVPLKEITD